MKKVSIFLIVVAAFLTVTLKSCKDEEKKDVPVTGVSFASDKQTLTEGSFLNLQYTVRPENATNKNVTFTSSKTDVATVDAISGRVTAKASGNTEITVTTEDGAKKDYCTVTVTKADVPVTDVVLGPAAITLNKVGEEYQLNASVVPANADNKLLEWESDKPAVATVDETGKVTALTSGTANVKVKTSEGAKEKTCVVTVDILVTGVTLDKAVVMLEVGETATTTSSVLTATVLPAEALSRDVVWSVDQENDVVETVLNEDGSYTVNAAGVGTAVITVTTKQGGFTASCTVSVALPPEKPVGADFEKAIIYNFSRANGGTVYPEFNTQVTPELAARFADMDAKNVLVAGRWDQCKNPHLVSVADLKQGKTDNIILLGTNGIVDLGGYSTSYGRLVNGHVYLCNLTLGITNESSRILRVYHWTEDNPGADAEEIATVSQNDISNFTGVCRYGDYMSVDLDENGNGYIYASGSTNVELLRITVSNYTQTSDPILIKPGNITANGGYWTSFHKIDGVQNEYLSTGNTSPVRLVEADGTELYSMTSFANAQALDAQVINFNEARYLLVMNDGGGVGGKCAITVYDITKGDTTTEALQIFDGASEEAKLPVYEFSLQANMPSGNYQVNVGFVKDGNDKLYIIGSGNSAGFAIIELPAVEDE